MLYVCLECGKQEIVKYNDYKIDGRSCNHCNGHLSPTGYAVSGIDISNGKDITVYMPPYKVMAKF